MRAKLKLGLAVLGVTLLSSFSPAQNSTLQEAWVSFSDKGKLTADEREDAFEELERSFDSHALQRRKMRRVRPGLFDDLDLPLNPAYLGQVSSTGAVLRVQSRWFNGVSVLATPAQLRMIQGLPFVAAVSEIHPYVPKDLRQGQIPFDHDLKGPPGPESRGSYGWSGPQIEQLQLHRLHAAGFRGAGIRIGVIDTGFLLSHPAFHHPDHPIRILAEWDFMDHDPTTAPEPDDSPVQHEHGSMVLGILASNLPGELVGSAPEADYILAKAEDEATEYHLEERWFAAALEFMEAHGADVVSSSIVLYEGYEPSEVDGRTSIMAQAWRIAVENGVIGLQGAGNSGRDADPGTHHLLPPAAVPGVITVGASGPTGEVAIFSSDGLEVEGTVKPEVLAWGQNTMTISPYEPGMYTATNGTSTATPLLAGGVACLLQAHPEWSTERLRRALFESGAYFLKVGHPDPTFVYGYGLPNLAQAAGIDLPGEIR